MEERIVAPMCPRCFSTGEKIKIVNNTHYVCQVCAEKGISTQFHIIEDTVIRFPYNQIYPTRKKSEFYRNPYIHLQEVGSRNL